MANGPYEFLSSEWIDSAREIRDEFGPVPTATVVVMNLVVTEAPFTPDPLHAHLNTARGPVAIESGHHPEPDVVITVEWVTAKALLVDGNPQAAMSAFMAGKVKVEGDMAKLLSLQSQTPDERAALVVERLRQITV